MSYIAQAQKAKVKPPILTIPGFPGAGKTTLAGLFPNPVFIQAEDSETIFESVQSDNQPTFLPRLPKPNAKKNISTKAILLEQLRELATEKHDFQTLVIDTVTSLNFLLELEIVEFFPGKESNSVQDACGGFQKAYDIIASWHNEIISACNHLRNHKNMGIVFLAHTGERKIKNNPELSGEYNVYGLNMHYKSEKIYTNLSDAVLYLKQIEYAQGHESGKKGETLKRGRITKTAERILITASDGVIGYVNAKTRYDRMPSEISVPKGTNPILQYISFYDEYVKTNKLEVSQEVENLTEEEEENGHK